MARGDAEFAALLRAMRHTPPPCDGDERFIRDEQPEADQLDMQAICHDCPLRELCEATARAMPVPGGWWAGKQYGAPTGRKTG